MSKSPFPEAFEARLIELLPDLRRYAVALTGSLADGDDLVQSVLIEALERRDRYRGGRMEAWLFSIMRSVWKNQMRRRLREQRLADLHLLQASLQDADRLDDHVIVGEVDRILATLPADWRELVLLICAYGYSYREASVALDLKIGTVTSRLSRIRRLVIDALGTPD
ncbi:MAG: RNA polymerase sigma factor [Alphaproteobacteria bacterium GM202ARS2]|nr:RNA polymerase sigma factor [Alphaproteobacteria bacterium GM202ARS2]